MQSSESMEDRIVLPDPKAVPEFVDPKEWRKYCHDTREYYAAQLPEEVCDDAPLTEGLIQPLNMSESRTFGYGYEDCEVVFVRYATYSFGGLLACCALFLPALMLYVGVNFYYCDDIFAPWLIIGGVICYMNCLLFLYQWNENRTCSLKKVVNKCKYFTFLVFSGIVIIWWLFGFVRIFSTGNTRRPDLGKELGMLDDPFMRDPVCKFYLYTFPFWLTLVPFIFIGIFILLVFCYACCIYCGNEDD